MAEGTVQLPADGVGSKLRTKTRTISAATVHEQQLGLAADDTFYAWSGSQACATSQQFITLLNTGAAQVLRLQALYLINTAAAAITGVALQFDLKKVTAVTVGTGTALTVQQMDSADTALATTTVATKAQTVTEGAVLYSYWTNNDEIGATNAFPTSVSQNGQNLIPDIPGVKKPTFRVNEGFTLKQITTSVVGSYGVLAVITREP